MAKQSHVSDQPGGLCKGDLVSPQNLRASDSIVSLPDSLSPSFSSETEAKEEKVENVSYAY